MDRNMDSAPDSRVHDFEPDRWQRDVLDLIDAKKSVFVVAPTSAGKTFISYVVLKRLTSSVTYAVAGKHDKTLISSTGSML